MKVSSRREMRYARLKSNTMTPIARADGALQASAPSTVERLPKLSPDGSSSRLLTLLSGFNCGTLKISVSSDGAIKHTLHSLTELLRTKGVDAIAPRYLDRGSFAKIYKLCVVGSTISLILKCAKQEETLVFSGAQVESFLLRYFFRQFVMTNISPHLPVVLSSTQSRVRSEVYSIAEHAKYRSLYFSLPLMCTDTDQIENLLTLFLFQAVYTLAWVHSKHPSFRHNDLTTSNVLLTENQVQGAVEYRAHNDEVFTLPPHKFRVILWDFDLACIDGLSDNARVYEFENENDGWGISSVPDPGMDVFNLVRWMCYGVRNKLLLTNTRFFESLCQLYPRDELLKPLHKKAPHVRPPKSDVYLPSAQEVLQSALFDIYRNHDASQPAPSRVYGSKNMDMEFLSQQDLDQMLLSNVLNAKDEYEYTLPLGFGAPDDVVQRLLELPAARAYHALYSKHVVPVSHPLTGPFTSKNVLKRVDKVMKFLSEMLREKGFKPPDMVPKIALIQERLVETVLLLGDFQRRYFKLIALIIFFNTGKFSQWSDYRLRIREYCSGQWTDSDVSIAMMQYKWIQILLHN